MRDQPHFIHFLVLVTVGDRHGWIAPVELPADTPQDGTLVAPLRPNGQLYRRYVLECFKYHGNGQSEPFTTEMELRDEYLVASVCGWTVPFRRRSSNDQTVNHPYIGKLIHPDLELRLTEIVPERPSQLDELYDRDRIVLAGCDPQTSYQGVDHLANGLTGKLKCSGEVQ